MTLARVSHFEEERIHKWSIFRGSRDAEGPWSATHGLQCGRSVAWILGGGCSGKSQPRRCRMSACSVSGCV